MENKSRPELLLPAILEALSVGPCGGTEVDKIVSFFEDRLVLDDKESASISEDMSEAVKGAIEMGKQLGLIRDKNGIITLAMTNTFKTYFNFNDN